MEARSTVVLATSNKGKVAELADMLAGFGLQVIGLDAFPDYPEPVEDGETFEANALIKARAAAAFTGLVAVADDSGLAVDALDGAPGIFSARYGMDIPLLEGESRDDRNIRKLLAALADVSEARRSAAFHCAMVAVAPNGEYITAEGVWDGCILVERRGSNGFGYDPVFYDQTLGRAAAELTREEKSAVSHRGRAVKGLLGQWSEFWDRAWRC